ncbi:MAG: class I SAM-dependent rRNA methyltransferase [Bacteroidales bacterium]|nr:class I SAM-dependent rRNA methyltransferase [Bacteroidales bacterium]
MNRPKLIIAPGKEKAILRRHPWIFSGAVKRIDGEPQEGDLVDVVDARGQWMATGHYQDESIICKVLSFDIPDIDADFFRSRLRSAIDYRARLGFFNAKDTNVFRLVHAEGDYLPGLVADWYNGVLVLQAHSVGMHRMFPELVEILKEELKPYGLQSIFDKSSATLPVSSPKLGEGDRRIAVVEECVKDGYLYGPEPLEHEITESGNRLLINFYEGQKTGFFIDQRENRALVQQLAFNHRLLNCFGYTGGFSLAALKGGADYVETVDISKKAIDLCNRNVEMNFPGCSNHTGTVADVLQYIQTIKQSDNQAFDFIILDPPAFAKNHRTLQQGLKGYRAINQRAMEKIAPGGLLMTFSCSQAVSKEDFQTMVFTAAMNAHRRVRIVRQLPHAMDHPVSIHHPEGEYLKGLLLEVE